MEEEIIFYGHPNIRAMHEMTIELTKTKEISLRADCIVGVSATKSCADLSDNLKLRLREENSVIKMSLIIGELAYGFTGYGSPSLSLAHRHDIVIRKSKFLCPRTIAINCDKASNNIPKPMIRMLREPRTKGIFRINVE